MPREPRFVNPYTFVSFPERIQRQAAPGHTPDAAQAGKRFTGSFVVTWTLESPMTLPARPTGADQTEWGRVGGEVRIPGSSIKGAVRSAHEALFAGCPRVVDLGYVPVYRESVNAGLLENWRLAVVIESAMGGIAKRVQLTDGEPTFLEATAVLAAYRSKAWAHLPPGERLPTSGDLVIPGTSSRQVITSVTRGAGRLISAAQPHAVVRPNGTQDFAQFGRDGYHVILVTDTAARTANTAGAKCYWASARVGPGAAVVGERAWIDFARNAKQSRDSKGDGQPRFEETTWPPEGNPQRHPSLGPPSPIGRRRRSDGRLLVGDVVWVRLDQTGEVSKIKTAAAWRESDPLDTLGSRMPDITPCTSHEAVCLSCAIFGSADDASTSPGEGRQQAYGGHVRFGTAISASKHVQGREQVDLAPLGLPHPGAGMFYLERRDPRPINPDDQRPQDRDDQPSRWGGSPDQVGNKKREIRGRKFYWHSDPERQTAAIGSRTRRYQKRDHHEPRTTKKVDLVCAKQSFEQTVTFDGLDEVALQSLFAAFEPGRVLGAGEYPLHLGGGKPLGLGTVVAVISQPSITRTADRYLEDPRQVGEEIRAKPVDLAELERRVGPLRLIHRQARQVFALGGLGAWESYVTYPTVRPWSEFGSEEFDNSYEFFGAQGGQVYAEKDPVTNRNRWLRKPWDPLPPLPDSGAGADPTIPIRP